MDVSGFAAQNDDLEAVVLVEVHVGCGHDHAELGVLNGMQLFLHVACMMVEHDRERSHDLGAGDAALIDDERVAHEVAYHLAAVFRKPATCYVRIEQHEKVLGHGDREPDQFARHADP